MRVPPHARRLGADPDLAVPGGRGGAAAQCDPGAGGRPGRARSSAPWPATIAAADRALRSLPGIGPWTSAEVRQRAHGDADAWSIHDYHVAKDITYALVGEPLDDAACLEILEPYRGHRYRVQLLLSLSAARRPRRAPRMTLPTHTPYATKGRS